MYSFDAGLVWGSGDGGSDNNCKLPFNLKIMIFMADSMHAQVTVIMGNHLSTCVIVLQPTCVMLARKCALLLIKP